MTLPQDADRRLADVAHTIAFHAVSTSSVPSEDTARLTYRLWDEMRQTAADVLASHQPSLRVVETDHPAGD